MTRFITLSCALLWLGPQVWAKKPPLTPISVCYGQVCLNFLRWIPANDAFGQPFPTIEGVLVNNTTSTITSATLEFAVMSGMNLRDTARASSSFKIPPGGRWSFEAVIDELDQRVFLSRCETVEFRFTLAGRGQTTDFEETLHFDPLFNPADRGAIKAWEKIHGRRER
jgi:hypothetical protein